MSRYQKGKNQSGFYWSKRQWVAVASAGPYACLHLAPEWQPHKHPSTLFLQAGCLSCRQTNSVKALKATTDRQTDGQKSTDTCSSRPHLTLFTGSRRKKRFYAHVSVNSYSDGVFVYFIMILLWCGTVNLFLFLVLFALFQGYWTSDRWNNASSWSTALWISQRTLSAR